MATMSKAAHGEQDDIKQANAMLFAQIFGQAYMEASDEIQTGIREMVRIVINPESDEDEKDMALFTLAEALFPEYDRGKLGIDLEDAQKAVAEKSDESASALAETDQEEAVFAERLKAKMEEKGFNQSQLAERANIGQPAISMMLKRDCRPQKRTVENLAEALGVLPEELWPFE